MIKSVMKRLESTTDRRLMMWMIAIFAVTHVLYYTIGRITIAGGWEFSWVLLDLNLLKNDLLRTVFYSHAHPPVFNMFVGILLKWFPGNEMVAGEVLYLLLGVAFYLAVYWLMRRFNVSKVLALILSTWFMISPSFVLLEQSISYDWILVSILTLSTVLLSLYLEKKRWWMIFLLFVIIAVMCATRTVFHLVYFAFIFAVVMVASPGHRKAVIVAALLPFLFVLSIYVKNFILFHHFTAGSGGGFNCSKILIRSTSFEERKRWVAEGVVSEIFLVEPAYPLSLFPKKYLEVQGFEGYPGLREPLKRDSVTQNLNHLGYLALSDDYVKETINAIRHYPMAEAFGLMSAWYCYFRATDESVWLGESRGNVIPMVNLYDYVFYGKVPWKIPYGKGYNVYLFLLIGLPLLYLYGARLALRKPGPETGLDARQRFVALYMVANIAYIIVLTNTLELAENQRGQFYTVSFVLIFLGIFLERAMAKRRNRKRVAQAA